MVVVNYFHKERVHGFLPPSLTPAKEFNFEKSPQEELPGSHQVSRVSSELTTMTRIEEKARRFDNLLSSQSR